MYKLAKTKYKHQNIDSNLKHWIKTINLNPDSNTNAIKILKAYFNKGYFIHFTEHPKKFSIVLRQDWETPFGTCGYLLDYNLITHFSKFAKDRKYIHIFRCYGNKLDFESYTEVDFNKDIEKLRDYYIYDSNSKKQFNEILNTVSGSFGKQIFVITEKLSKYDTKLWSKIFVNILGYDYIIDKNYGIIHPGCPSQVVALSNGTSAPKLELINTIENVIDDFDKYIKKEYEKIVGSESYNDVVKNINDYNNDPNNDAINKLEKLLKSQNELTINELIRINFLLKRYKANNYKELIISKLNSMTNITLSDLYNIDTDYLLNDDVCDLIFEKCYNYIVNKFTTDYKNCIENIYIYNAFVDCFNKTNKSIIKNNVEHVFIRSVLNVIDYYIKNEYFKAINSVLFKLQFERFPTNKFLYNTIFNEIINFCKSTNNASAIANCISAFKARPDIDDIYNTLNNKSQNTILDIIEELNIKNETDIVELLQRKYKAKLANNNLFTLIKKFCKLSQQPNLTQLPSSLPSNKPNVEYRDRFNGAEGENRKQLIQQEAIKNGYTLVENKITPLNPSDIKINLSKIIANKYPEMTQEMIDEFVFVLMAQIKLETGMKSSHNWNVGNIHATKGGKNQYWKGLVSAWNDPQVGKDGKQYVNVDWFWRAYSSLEEGLGDYYSFLEKRFPAAVEYAKQGDAYNFGLALGKSGYYTANKNVYSKGLAKIKQQFQSKPL